jgi:hypothetical protein
LVLPAPVRKINHQSAPLILVGTYQDQESQATQTPRPKPQWEFPRLCRGGSKSLTYPAVDAVGPSTKL